MGYFILSPGSIYHQLIEAEILHLQFSAMYHITNDQEMTVAAKSHKNSCYSEQCEHLFSCLRSCTSPALNTDVEYLLGFVVLGDIEPGNIIISGI
jgi:hypothetical protein